MNYIKRQRRINTIRKEIMKNRQKASVPGLTILEAKGKLKMKNKPLEEELKLLEPQQQSTHQNLILIATFMAVISGIFFYTLENRRGVKEFKLEMRPYLVISKIDSEHNSESFVCFQKKTSRIFLANILRL